MDDLEYGTWMQQQIFYAIKLEEYVAKGVFDDIQNNVITEKEGEKVFRLARLQTDIPGLFNRWIPPPPIEEDDMSLTNTVILYKDPDQGFPKEEVVKAAAGMTHSVTLASIQDGKIVHVTMPGAADEDALVGHSEGGFKKVAMVALFSKVELAQPFHVLGNQDDPDIVGFIQGDFRAVPDIVKEVSKIFKGADDFVDGWNTLKESGNRLIKFFRGDAAVGFFNRDGGWAVIENAKIEKDYDWGCSYSTVQADTGGTNQPEPKPADGPKTDAGPFGNLTKGSAAPAPQQIAAELPAKYKKPTAGVPICRTVDNKSAVQFQPGQEDWDRCPETVQIPGGQSWRKISREENQQWHMTYVGHLPGNYKERPIIPWSMFIKNPRGGDLPTTADTSTAALATATGVKDVATKHVAASHILDDSTLKDFKGTFCVKIFGQNMEVMQNPDVMFAELDDIPPVTAKLGLAPNFFDAMPHVARLQLCTEHPLVASRVLGDSNKEKHLLRNRVKELESRVQEQEEEIEKLTKPSSPFGNLTKPQKVAM